MFFKKFIPIHFISFEYDIVVCLELRKKQMPEIAKPIEIQPKPFKRKAKNEYLRSIYIH